MRLFHGWVLFTVLFCSRPTFAQSQEVLYENSSGSPLVSSLNSARRSIDIEIYEMDDPMVQAAIVSAVKRGVKVRVIQEDHPVGVSCKMFESEDGSETASCQKSKQLVEYIRRTGGQYVPFNHDALCGISGSHCYQHGKIVIVDGSFALVSTGNFNSTSICNKREHPGNCNRDYTVLSQDSSVVSTLETFFENDLSGQAYDVAGVLSQAPTNKLTVSPFSLQPMNTLISSATSTLKIQNQYLEDPEMNQAIMDAARRGVDVEVTVSSPCSFGKPTGSAIRKWENIFGAFESAGVKIHIFTRRMQVGGVSGYLHAKAILVDGNLAWVGSVNGSVTSLTDNREYGIYLTEASEVQKLSSFMDQDFSDPNGESWQDSLECRNDPRPASPKPEGFL